MFESNGRTGKVERKRQRKKRENNTKIVMPLYTVILIRLVLIIFVSIFKPFVYFYRIKDRLYYSSKHLSLMAFFAYLMMPFLVLDLELKFF